MSTLLLDGGQAGALPLVQVEPVPGFLLVQGGSSASDPLAEEPLAPLSDLNELLGATRAKLEELTEATALVAVESERRSELQALKKDNDRLAGELEQASARRGELERAGDLAEARIAELTKAAGEARRETARLNDGLVELRQQNERLHQSLTRADAAREAALAEAESIRADTAKKLQVAADDVERLRAELAGGREEFETRRRELAEANRLREQVEGRVIALEQVAQRSGAEAERLKTELSEARAQLGQAAGAAVAAERARQAAGSEAEALRGEAKRAREELAAARDENARLEAANVGLEQQMASLQRDWRSATEAARDNLILMEEKIRALNAAFDLARPEDAPADGQAKPEAVEEESDAPSRGSSALVQPPAPEADDGTESGQAARTVTTLPVIGVTAARAESPPIDTATVALEKLIESLPDTPSATGTARHDPIMTDEQIKAALTGGPRATLQTSSAMAEPSVPAADGNADANQPGSATTLAMVDPAAAPPQDDSALASFRANVRALNDLELNAEGADLFSGVESVSGREVSVSATAAWDALPRVGKQSYLDYLLDAWVAVRAGEGPAVVRIIDPNGQVLVEKSQP